jgi:hypothetical protein
VLHADPANGLPGIAQALSYAPGDFRWVGEISRIELPRRHFADEPNQLPNFGTPPIAHHPGRQGEHLVIAGTSYDLDINDVIVFIEQEHAVISHGSQRSF